MSSGHKLAKHTVIASKTNAINARKRIRCGFLFGIQHSTNAIKNSRNENATTNVNMPNTISRSRCDIPFFLQIHNMVKIIFLQMIIDFH
jgi:hypothetical protein